VSDADGVREELKDDCAEMVENALKEWLGEESEVTDSESWGEKVNCVVLVGETTEVVEIVVDFVESGGDSVACLEKVPATLLGEWLLEELGENDSRALAVPEERGLRVELRVMWGENDGLWEVREDSLGKGVGESLWVEVKKRDAVVNFPAVEVGASCVPEAVTVEVAEGQKKYWVTDKKGVGVNEPTQDEEACTVLRDDDVPCPWLPEAVELEESVLDGV